MGSGPTPEATPGASSPVTLAWWIGSGLELLEVLTAAGFPTTP
jgi:hypothetical protein